jgi:ATP-dependent RNA helicase DDX54/DBP10
MPNMRRASSPAMSETEVDISKNLFLDDVFDSDAEGQAKPAAKDNGPKNKKRKTDNVVDAFEDDDDEDEAFIAATQVKANRKSENKVAKKAGAFQSMGLNAVLLKAITRKGFNVPTPIQRKTVPLIMDGQDVVGMARTGSGKTAAFVIPMIEKLKSHSAKVGARAIILSPSRELALQTLKVVKEMGRGTDLRSTLLVGGDSLEDQFSSMASNPDIIIATPGRFEHLKVEMGLELSSVKYVVFDEADRLFEMGFAAQLTEIMHSLPTTRQTLLFSATLPKSLVEFARAGLQDPKLVRLDAESKIAPGLQSAFFTVKRAEKEASLLYILQEVIKMPTGETEAAIKAKKGVDKKRKRDGPGPKQMPTPHSTVIFASTKHHVEYLAAYLKTIGYATSFVYGALDQTARKMQTEEFRTGMSNILVVTDVAARGLDIPVLANVINYDFPPQPKVFIHRVGRTARAGESGWSYSLISQHDMPYLVDLQLFLGRKLLLGRAQPEENMFKDAIVVGTLVRDKLERYMEEAAKTIDNDSDLSLMREVAGKGEKQYLRTRNPASAESVKRAKNLALSASEASKGSNLLFEEDEQADDEQARLAMLARVSNFKPQETVFEVGKRGAAATEMSEIMQKRRNQQAARDKAKAVKAAEAAAEEADAAPAKFDRGEQESDDEDDDLVLTQPGLADMEEASDGELELTFTQPESLPGGKKANKWQDSEHFMSYNPKTINVAEDRGYGVNSGGVNVNNNFVSDAKGATMDLANDDDKAFATANKVNSMRWDKKNKKYVSRANDVDGSKGSRYITGESGQKIAASFRSGRFDAWKKANKVSHLPRVGEMEKGNSHRFADGNDGKRFKHKQEKAPKEADKYRDDYDERKKRVDAAKEARRGRFAEGKGKSEIRSVDDVRKTRRDEQKKKEKNARPQKRR